MIRNPLASRLRPALVPVAVMATALVPSAGRAGSPPPAAASSVSVWVTARDTVDRLASKAPVPFAALEQPEEHAPTVIIDPSKLFQTIEGFGGALTDASAETWAKLPAGRQQELLEAYFDPEKGIGYSLCRTHIHSCDFSSESYAYTEVPGDVTLEHFRIDHDRRYKLPFIRAALRSAGARQDLRLPLEPAGLDEDNGNMLQGGQLKPEYREAWARYYVSFMQEYEEEGVRSGASRCRTSRWRPRLGSPASSRPQRSGTSFATTSARRSRSRPLPAQADDLGPQPRDLFQRAKAVYDDPAAAGYVWGAGFHWYVGDHFDNVRQVHDAWPDKRCCSPRAASQYDSTLGEWKWGEIYAPRSQRPQQLGGGMDRLERASRRTRRPEPRRQLLLRSVLGDTGTGELTYTNSYWYIGHVSKFVRPGARRIACTSNDDDLLASAFVLPRGRVTRRPEQDRQGQGRAAVDGRPRGKGPESRPLDPHARDDGRGRRRAALVSRLRPERGRQGSGIRYRFRCAVRREVALHAWRGPGRHVVGVDHGRSWQLGDLGYRPESARRDSRERLARRERHDVRLPRVRLGGARVDRQRDQHPTW